MFDVKISVVLLWSSLLLTPILLQSVWDLNIIPLVFQSIVNDNNTLYPLDATAELCNAAFAPTNVLLKYYSYDYVIVGSGPSGSALANRLSADSTKKVLLIEAGLPESPLQQIPLAATLSISSKYFKRFVMNATENAGLNMIDQQCAYPVGRSVGGSSVVNFMIYTRGNKDDFDRWEAAGGPDWNFANSTALYNEFEWSTANGSTPNDVTGTLPIENPPYQTCLLEKYLAAGREIFGGADAIDYNRGTSQLGIGVVQGTSKNGKRMSAKSAYIDQIFPPNLLQRRPNLHIFTGALATKIVFDSNKKATGVQFRQNGLNYLARASREVILSAGPVGSAHLLMVSGVGPSANLAEHNIPLVADLPVGEFYDHPFLVAPTFLVNTTDVTLNLKKVTPLDFAEWPAGEGVTTMYLGLEAVAFHKTSTSTRPATCPDLEFVFMSGGIHSDYGVGFRKMARINQTVYDDYFAPLQNTTVDAISTIIVLLHSSTKGRISLVSGSIDTDPKIEYPFYDNPEDLERVLEGIKISKNYSQTEALQSIGARLYEKKLIGCEAEEFDSDDYWRCYIKRMTMLNVHMVASNRMGADGVVDGRLRVRGTQNLRVVDTSVMPVTVSGHTQAPGYLIGERGARIIIQDNL